MEETHATPLPESIVHSPEKSNSPQALTVLALFLVGLFVIIITINIGLYFYKRKDLGKIIIPCPVAPEYCKQGKVLKGYVAQEKTTYISLGFLVPETEPVFAVEDNIFYEIMHVADSGPAPDPQVNNKSIIGADFSIKPNKYRITYIFEGTPLTKTKKYHLGEEIGKMQGKDKYGGFRRSFNFSVKDEGTNTYLTPRVSQDGKTIEFIK